MKITVTRGLTINKGNYESERIDVGVEVEIADSILTVGIADDFDAGYNVNVVDVYATWIERLDAIIEAKTGRRL